MNLVALKIHSSNLNMKKLKKNQWIKNKSNTATFTIIKGSIY